MATDVDDFPEGTAYHEAGHAVITRLLGFHTKRLCLGTGGRNEPYGNHELVEDANKLTKSYPTREVRLSQACLILILLAGPTAERLFAKSPTFLPGHEHDKKQAYELIHCLVTSRVSPEAEEKRKAEFERRCVETAGLLQQPTTWALVQKIATELLSRRSLAADEIAKLYDEADGFSGPIYEPGL